MRLDARKTLIAWNPGSDQIKVGHLIGENEYDWSYDYKMTGGAAYAWVRTAPDSDLQAGLKADFIAIVFRDGVCPVAAYREFSKITQFVDAVPRDMPEKPNLYGWAFSTT